MEQSAIAEAFQRQAGWCRDLGSQLYERLLLAAADDILEGGPVWRLVSKYDGRPGRDALALVLLGAVHARVIAGTAPELAAFYPTAGGWPEYPAAIDAFLEFVEANGDHLTLDGVPQTNEIRRSAVLLGGFLEATRSTGLPLRLMELGASAGLNLLFDRYHFDLGIGEWGPRDSPVRIRSQWLGRTPDLGATVPVMSRAGCDIAPLDVASAEDMLWLSSFIWPEQIDRLELLRAAIAHAADMPPALAGMSAAQWLKNELTPLPDRVCTVVFHSVMWQYMSDEEQHSTWSVISSAGREASPTAPLVWLRMEPQPSAMELRATTWPSREERLLAVTQAHGRRVTWLDTEPGHEAAVVEGELAAAENQLD